jgi:hypothetical protein
MVECFVGLLRSSKSAIISDIKMYLSNMDKLMYKMKNLQPVKIPIEVIEHIDVKLARYTNTFVDPKNPGYLVNSPFILFFAWC